MAASENLDISVIVVNYRTPEYAKRAIESVLQSASPLKVEIIVVDNASGDGSVEILRRQWDDRIIILENDENYGFAKANNQGIRLGTGRYYLLLNSDAMVVDDAISQLVTYAESHPKAAIVGPRVVGGDGLQQASCWRKYSLAYLLSRALGLYRILPDGWLGVTNIEVYGKPIQTRPVEVVSGCVMLVRREAAERVGLFDERYFMYCEDMDWCTEMWQMEYEVHYLSEATVRHYGGGTSASMRTTMSIEQSRSTLKFFRKHYGVVTAFFANFLLGLFFLLRLPIWLCALFRDRKRIVAKQKINSYWFSLLWHIKWPLLNR